MKLFVLIFKKVFAKTKMFLKGKFCKFCFSRKRKKHFCANPSLHPHSPKLVSQVNLVLENLLDTQPVCILTLAWSLLTKEYVCYHLQSMMDTQS